jgi:hypothetical protein
MHIAVTNPIPLTRDQVSEDIVTKESNTAICNSLPFIYFSTITISSSSKSYNNIIILRVLY